MSNPLIKNRLSRFCVTAILAPLAFALNFLTIELMFGVGILLGSSLAYFSLRLIGWKSAVFIAAASGLATIFIWGHPYALIVFALELVVVSILFKRFEWSIVTAAMFYWILLGAPLAYVLYTQLLGMPGAALLIALKQSVNGIFLAVLADVAFVLFSILISKRKRAPLVTLTDVIRSLLIILFSAPLLFLLTTTSKGLRESAEFRLGWAVEQNVRYFSSRVDAWVSGSILASAAQAADLAQQWNQTCEAPIQKSPTTSQLRFVQAVSNVPFEKPRRPLPSYFAAESILIEVIEGQQQYGVRIAVNAALPNCDEPGYLIFESFYQPSYLDLSEFKPYPLQGLSLIETGGSTLFQMGIVPAAEHMEPASFEMTHDGGRLLSTYLPASGQPMTSWQQASVIAQIPSTVVANWLYTAVVGYSQIISEIQAEQSRLLALFLVLALFVGYLGQGFSKILLASHTQFVTNPSHRSPEERLELARATPLGWVQEIDEVISQLASYERTAMNSMEEEASRYAVTKILADKLAQFVATANVPIFSIDPDGLVLEWNAKAEELTGFGSDQVVTRPLAERLVQDGKSREVVTSALRQAVSGVPVANISAKFRTSSGAQIRFFLNVSPNYDEYGDITGASLVAQDVTLLSDERDKLDKLATAKTELLQAILALNSDGVIAIGANGFIEHANDVIIQLLGVPESDVLGKTEDWFNDQLRQKLIASQNAGILESADEKSIELYLNSPEPHVLERAVKVQSDPDGRLIRKVMYFRDVTVAKEVQRLKTEFLTNAAHELRTPLASIFGFSELLMSRSFDQESGKNIIATIHRQSGVMVSLINDILNLSRLENRQSADTVFTEQDLKPAVFEAIESMDVRDDDRKVIVDVPDDIFLVSYDKKKMVLALNHLLENAYKFSPLGGDILVTVSSLSRNTRDYVCVQVKDEGVGMSKIELQHIFDRFYKIEAAETDPGSGLGLALVKEIVRIHSGEIDVVSTPGLGTSFNMYFPLAGKVSAKDNEIPGNN